MQLHIPRLGFWISTNEKSGSAEVQNLCATKMLTKFKSFKQNRKCQNEKCSVTHLDCLFVRNRFSLIVRKNYKVHYLI